MRKAALRTAQSVLAKAGVWSALSKDAGFLNSAARFESKKFRTLAHDLRSVSVQARSMNPSAASITAAIHRMLTNSGLRPARGPADGFEDKEAEPLPHLLCAEFGQMLGAFRADCEQAAKRRGLERPEAAAGLACLSLLELAPKEFHDEISAQLEAELLRIAHPAPKQADPARPARQSL